MFEAVHTTIVYTQLCHDDSSQRNCTVLLLFSYEPTSANNASEQQFKQLWC